MLLNGVFIYDAACAEEQRFYCCFIFHNLFAIMLLICHHAIKSLLSLHCMCPERRMKTRTCALIQGHIHNENNHSRKYVDVIIRCHLFRMVKVVDDLAVSVCASLHVHTFFGCPGRMCIFTRSHIKNLCVVSLSVVRATMNMYSVNHWVLSSISFRVTSFTLFTAGSSSRIAEQIYCYYCSCTQCCTANISVPASSSRQGSPVNSIPPPIVISVGRAARRFVLVVHSVWFACCLSCLPFLQCTWRRDSLLS